MNITNNTFCNNGAFAIIAIVVAFACKFINKRVKTKIIRVLLPFITGAITYLGYYVISIQNPFTDGVILPLTIALSCGGLSVIYTYAYDATFGKNSLRSDASVTQTALKNLLTEMGANDTTTAVERIEGLKSALENGNNITHDVYVILLEVLPETTELEILSLTATIISILNNDF